MGALLWVANQTRPDLGNTIQALDRRSHNPSKSHWTIGRQALTCLKGTRDPGLLYELGEGLELLGYDDTSFAGKSTDQRSASGGAVMFVGTAVSWFSRSQKCVALSPTEAEYMTMGECKKELLFLQHALALLRPNMGTPCLVLEDNVEPVHLAQNPLSSARSKHIDVRHHFLRDLVGQGVIEITHVPSKDQSADARTKFVELESFRRHVGILMNSRPLGRLLQKILRRVRVFSVSSWC
ncbi:unnamed protein product [Discosporangium mesarthrocarpum]